MSWLLRDSERPAAPVNTAPLRALLAQYEGVFSATAAHRAEVDRQLGTEASPPRRAALANLHDAARQQIGALTAQIAHQFAAAKAAAQANRARAARDFHASAEGAQYLTALGVFAALAPQMTDGQLAARIAAALDDGLAGQARAWAELGAMRGAKGGDLYLALDRAKAGALSLPEITARAEADYLDTAERRFGLFARNLTDGRLAEALERGTANHAAGYFDAPNIMGDAPVEAGNAGGE